MAAASVNLDEGFTNYGDALLAGQRPEPLRSRTDQDNSDNPPVPDLKSADGGDPGSPGATASGFRSIFGGSVGAGIGGTGGAAAGALEGGVEGGLIGIPAGPPGIVIGGSAGVLAGGTSGAIAGAAGGAIVGAGLGAATARKLGDLVVYMEGNAPASPATGQPTNSNETTTGGEIDPGSSNRGLTFVGENLGVPRSPAMQPARDYESATEGASSDVATRQRQVPALRYDNINPKGTPYVRFDGYRLLDDGTTELIDAKMRIVPFSTAEGPFISDSGLSGLTRQSAALEQNPGHTGVRLRP